MRNRRNRRTHEPHHARLTLARGLLGAAFACHALICVAQTYPVRPVRVIAPTSPGSGSDILTRVLTASLTQSLGQQFIVENRASGNGNLGAEIAARAPADGYHLFIMTITHAVNVTLYRSLAYDIVRDFAPVTQLASSPNVIVVHPSLPVQSVSELVKLAKARPGAINYASAGTGSPVFLATELFKARAGVSMIDVPYKGGGQAQASILAGETSIYFASVVTAAPHVRSQRLRALAVTSARRLALLPEYPTVAESGFPGYQFGSWYGLLAPAKTPRDSVTALRAATAAALNDAAINKRLIDLGYVPVGDTAEEFAAFIRSEITTLGALVKSLRLSAD